MPRKKKPIKDAEIPSNTYTMADLMTRSNLTWEAIAIRLQYLNLELPLESNGDNQPVYSSESVELLDKLEVFITGYLPDATLEMLEASGFKENLESGGALALKEVEGIEVDTPEVIEVNEVVTEGDRILAKAQERAARQLVTENRATKHFYETGDFIDPKCAEEVKRSKQELDDCLSKPKPMKFSKKLPPALAKIISPI